MPIVPVNVPHWAFKLSNLLQIVGEYKLKLKIDMNNMFSDTGHLK